MEIWFWEVKRKGEAAGAVLKKDKTQENLSKIEGNKWRLLLEVNMLASPARPLRVSVFLPC